jgi:hypothetical protein
MEENVAGYVEDSFCLVIVEYGKYVVGDNFFDSQPSAPLLSDWLDETTSDMAGANDISFLSLSILHFNLFL